MPFVFDIKFQNNFLLVWVDQKLPINYTLTKMSEIIQKFCRLGPECSATGIGQFPICKLKWDLLRTSVTACTIDENVFSAPFGIFYIRREI